MHYSPPRKLNRKVPSWYQQTQRSFCISIETISPTSILVFSFIFVSFLFISPTARARAFFASPLFLSLLHRFYFWLSLFTRLLLLYLSLFHACTCYTFCMNALYLGEFNLHRRRTIFFIRSTGSKCKSLFYSIQIVHFFKTHN